jgi:hypothetical protein
MSTVLAFGSARTAVAFCWALSAVFVSSSWLLSDRSGDRGHGREHRGDPAPRRDRDDVLGLRARRLQDAVTQGRARRRPVRGRGERGRDLPEGCELLLALRAVAEVRLVRLPLGRLECIQRVAGGQLVD